MKKAICYILILSLFGGMFLLFGTVGASDLEIIDLNNLLLRGTIGAVLMIVSLICLKWGGFESGI